MNFCRYCEDQGVMSASPPSQIHMEGKWYTQPEGGMLIGAPSVGALASREMLWQNVYSVLR